jgi:hypothetical protein
MIVASKALRSELVSFLNIMFTGNLFSGSSAATAALWSAARDSLMPLLLTWLDSIDLDIATLTKLGLIVGLLCKPLNADASQLMQSNSEFDFVSQIIRVLKLKAKQDHGQQQTMSGGSLFALSAATLSLINFCQQNNEVAGALRYAEFTHRLVEELIGMLNTYLNEGSQSGQGQLIAVQVTGMFLHSLSRLNSPGGAPGQGSDPSRKRKFGDVASTDSAIDSGCLKLKELLLELVKFETYSSATEQTYKQIDSAHKTTYAAVEAIALAASYRIEGMQDDGSNNYAVNAFNRLFARELWSKHLTVVGRFCLAESIYQLLHYLLSSNRTAAAGLKVLSSIEARCRTSGGNRNERTTSMVLLLVLARNRYLSKLNEFENCMDSLSSVEATSPLLRVAELFLLCLQENDVFIQDVCCLGLYHVYQEAVHVDASENDFARGSSCSSNDSLAIAEKVSIEVIATLTRDKRKLAPGGFALAGENTGTSAQGDIARAIAGAANRNASNAGGTGSGAGGDGNANQNNREFPDRDELLAAAATAASQLGMTPEEIAQATARLAGGNQQTPANRQPANPDAGIFGIYAAACKVAKKSGDSSIVFYVLANIQRDPSFSTQSSNNTSHYEIYRRYAATAISVPIERLKAIVPMLYMYRHDVSSVIKELMRSLWEVLVISERREYLTRTLQTQIIAYLTTNMNSKNWKERYSAATALEQIFSAQLAHSWSAMSKHMNTIWDCGFYMLDDVKDENRVAALQLVKLLAESALRYCDQSLSSIYDNSVAQEIVEFLVPKVLNKGLLSPCAEGKGFALGVLNRVIKQARGLLGDHRPAILSVLIECMSAFEPQMLQYMQFHTSRMSISDEELERIRLRMASESPMQEALDICLQSLDIQCVSDSLRVVTRQVTAGVGLATRVAALRALSTIGDTYGERVGTECIPAFRAVLDLSLASSKAAVTLRQALVGAVGALSKVRFTYCCYYIRKLQFLHCRLWIWIVCIQRQHYY